MSKLKKERSPPNLTFRLLGTIRTRLKERFQAGKNFVTGYVDNIEKITEENNNFRQVLFTGTYAQLVAMSLQAGEDIGMEVHDLVDQFFRIESGEGKVIMNDEETAFGVGSAIIVPAGTRHNVIATTAVKLYTLYSPPNHPADRVQATKAEAVAAEEEHV